MLDSSLDGNNRVEHQVRELGLFSVRPSSAGEPTQTPPHCQHPLLDRAKFIRAGTGECATADPLKAIGCPSLQWSLQYIWEENRADLIAPKKQQRSKGEVWV
jgi:hypothetical protein